MTDHSPFTSEVQSIALALIRQYGGDAEVIATMQAAEFAAVGDVAALETWDQIIACIEVMQSEAGAQRLAPLH